jgi:hypothetical protein
VDIVHQLGQRWLVKAMQHVLKFGTGGTFGREVLAVDLPERGDQRVACLRP